MAILKQYPGLEVQIMVGQQLLQEYDDPDSSPESNNVRKYVETKSDCNFGVGYALHKPFQTTHSVRAAFFINGHIVRRICHRVNEKFWNNNVLAVSHAKWWENGVRYQAALRFTEIQPSKSSSS